MISLAIPDFATWEGKIFVGVLGFSWATYMWEEYLAYRQVGGGPARGKLAVM